MHPSVYRNSPFAVFFLFSILLQNSLFAQSVKKGKAGNARATVKTTGRTKAGTGVVTANAIDPQKIRDWSQAQETAKPYIEEKTNGSINWTAQYIEAKGESVIDNERFKNPAQARLMAQRGAVVVAQRNLLEIIKGVNVTGETSVEDMITTKDYIYTRIDGVIKGAQMVNEPVVKDGYVEVRMRVSIYEGTGVAQAVYDEIPEGSPSQEGSSNQNSGGEKEEAIPAGDQTNADTSSRNPVLFNITNPGTWKPSMFPVITDENGKVVLDLSSIYDPTKGKFPKILGITKEVFEAAGWKKGVNTIDLIARQDGKLVLPEGGKRKINWKKIGNTVADIGRFIFKLI